jgi:hypothetical protein
LANEKIFTDDPLIHYASTQISAIRTRAEIDSLLALYGIYEVAWHWKPEQKDIWVMFHITEEINGKPVKVTAKIVCNILWDKGNKLAKTPEKRAERSNIAVSVRALYYYIKAGLQASYSMQSSKVAAFLPNITNNEGKTTWEKIEPFITAKNGQYALLEDNTQEFKPEVRAIPQRNRISGEFSETF